MSAHAEKKSASLDNLIEDEWEILCSLKGMMENSELSVSERLNAANAHAYHASVLSKLLAQKGACIEFNEPTLGEFVRGIQPKMARRGGVDFRHWMRRRSLRRQPVI